MVSTAKPAGKSVRKAPVDEKSLAAPSETLQAIFGAFPTIARIAVTPGNAMKCAAVRRAVQAIAEPLGQIPVHVYKRDGDSRERDRDHPVAKVLLDPNDWTSSSDFREQLQRDALLHGNGYAYIVREGDDPVEMIRLNPVDVAIEVDESSGAPTYQVKSGNEQKIYDFADVFHIKAPSLDGYIGESIVRQCAEAISTAMVLEEHGIRLFANGARPSGVIQIPGPMGEEALTKMKAGWKASHEGSENSGKTAVLWNGATFNALTFNSVDAQFLELRRYAVDEIARAFGVPPHLLFEMGRATWGNAEELGANFVTFTLMRWLKAWQGEIRLKLFTAKQREEFFAEFLVDDLLKADIAARSTAYSQLVAARVLNPNEVRARENLPPYAGGAEFVNPNTTSSAPDGAKENV
jgi:HK97 family phage portal protein